MTLLEENKIDNSNPKELLNRIKAKGLSDKIISGAPRYTIWSGHDSSISTFEMFMKYTFNTKWIFPSFASTILFELYKIEDKNIYEIKYFVNDELLLLVNN